MPIETTGNPRVDTAAAEIAVALRDASPGRREQSYYDEAIRLRDEIMRGTRELDSQPPPAAGVQVVEATRATPKDGPPPDARFVLSIPSGPGGRQRRTLDPAYTTDAARWAGQALGNMAVGTELIAEALENGWARAQVGGAYSRMLPDGDEPARPGESLASRKQAADVLAGFGLEPEGIRYVLRRAYGHGSASFNIHGDPDRLGHVDYDREHGTYTVRTPATEPARS